MCCHDVPSIYSVPEVLYEQGITKVILKKLNLTTKPNISNWKQISKTYTTFKGSIKFAIIGKYVDLKDTYVSVYQTILHSDAKFGKEIEIEWIDSERLEIKPDEQDVTTGYLPLSERLKSLDAYDGILIPGGFGSRGSEGIINASNYARQNNIPYLGICFGFQLAIVAFARNICNLSDANTTEINQNTKNPVVVYMPEQDVEKLWRDNEVGDAHNRNKFRFCCVWGL